MSATDDLVSRAFDGRELVACVDGPRAGAWYFLDWWKTQREIALRFGGETPYKGSVLGYVAQGVVPHPRNAGVEGHALTWQPELADADLRHKARVAAAR